MEKLIITAALTGNVPTKEKKPKSAGHSSGDRRRRSPMF